MKLETRIMQEIKEKKVKMKPKWWFVAQKESEKGILGILFLGIAVLLAGVIYSIDLLSPGELISTGTVGREVLADSLPYKMVLLSLVFLVVGGFTYLKFGENYRKTWGVVALRVAAVVTVVTVILTIGRMMLERGFGL